MTERFIELLNSAADDDIDFADELAKINEGIEEKVRNGIGLLQTLKHRADSYNAEIQRLSKLKKAVDKNIESIERYYLDNLSYTGQKKIVTSIGTMAVVRAGGKKPLIIDNEELIPAAYKKARYEVDKESLREDLEQGVVVDGVHFAERTNYLKIS